MADINEIEGIVSRLHQLRKEMKQQREEHDKLKQALLEFLDERKRRSFTIRDYTFAVKRKSRQSITDKGREFMRKYPDLFPLVNYEILSVYSAKDITLEGNKFVHH